MYSLSVLVQEIRGMKDKLGEKLEVIKSKEGTVTSTVHKTSKRSETEKQMKVHNSCGTPVSSPAVEGHVYTGMAGSS